MRKLRMHHSSSACRLDRGFTLVEVMVAVALVALMATFALPSWRQMQARSAVRATVNDLSMSLLLARSEAVRLNSPVTVCPSNTGIACTNSNFEAGWIVAIGLPQDNAPRVLQDHQARTGVRTGFNGVNNNRAITFLPNGQPRGLPLFTVMVCPSSTDLGAWSMNVAVNQTGRPRLTDPGACEIP